MHAINNRVTGKVKQADSGGLTCPNCEHLRGLRTGFQLAPERKPEPLEHPVEKRVLYAKGFGQYPRPRTLTMSLMVHACFQMPEVLSVTSVGLETELRRSASWALHIHATHPNKNPGHQDSGELPWFETLHVLSHTVTR